MESEDTWTITMRSTRGSAKMDFGLVTEERFTMMEATIQDSGQEVNKLAKEMDSTRKEI